VRRLLSLLWRGKTEEALAELRKMAVKNEKYREQLILYLEKHQTEIIDYQRRTEAGKPIGSGRIENTVNQVIGSRQKKKGMSWTSKGSKALAVVTAHALNNRAVSA
jgi:hypothetical protein